MRAVYFFAVITAVTTFTLVPTDINLDTDQKCDNCDSISVRIIKANDSIILDNAKMSENIVSKVKNLDSINKNYKNKITDLKNSINEKDNRIKNIENKVNSYNDSIIVIFVQD